MTPSFNQGRFLRHTIESVMKQTYAPIEYLVIDGGSTDETLEILRSYAGQFTWLSEPDKGQADAINKGFARARGVFRAYLNSDDILLPGAVETVIDYFTAHPECDLVYGMAYYIDEDNHITGMYRTEPFSLSRLKQGCCICQPAAFWRASIAERVGSFNPDLSYVMDFDYWVRLAQAGGKIAYMPVMLAASRLHAATKTLSGREYIFREMIQVCRAHFGHADLPYFIGLWHALSWHRPLPWVRCLRRLPKFYQFMGLLHYFYFHRFPTIFHSNRKGLSSLSS